MGLFLPYSFVGSWSLLLLSKFSEFMLLSYPNRVPVFPIFNEPLSARVLYYSLTLKKTLKVRSAPGLLSLIDGVWVSGSGGVTTSRIYFCVGCIVEAESRPNCWKCCSAC